MSNAAEQVYRSDPLGGQPRRFCRRPRKGEDPAQVRRDLVSQAESWVIERRLIKEAQERGMHIVSPSQPSSVTTFERYLTETYLPWARSSTEIGPRTLEARRGILTILAEDIGNAPLDQIQNLVGDLIVRWRDEGCRYTTAIDRLGRPTNRRPRPITSAGINERIKVLSAVLGHAHEIARVLDAPPKIRLIKNKGAHLGASEPVRFFRPEEKLRFLKYSRSDMVDVFQLGVLTGMRPAELFHLRVDAVDLRASKIWVKACACPSCPDGRWVPKTGRYRVVDVAPDLRPILRGLIKGQPDDALVIRNRHGAPYSRLNGSGGVFIKTLRRAGLDRQGLSFYSLRHTFASDLVSAGKPIKEVADLLGNSVRVCEERYGKLQAGVTRETVKALKAVVPWPAKAEESRALVVPAGAPSAKRDEAKIEAA